jgi:hypothetical protein
MQQYNSISELIKDFNELHYLGRIYLQNNKKNDFVNSTFWILSSKEAKDQEMIETKYGLIPESLIDFEVASFIDVASFQDIIENVIENNEIDSNGEIDLFIKAIKHYLDEDDFLF